VPGLFRGSLSSKPEKEVFIMNCSIENANKCIACSVTQCDHHCGTADYCTLDSIHIGTHESDPTRVPCTDCLNFVKK